MPGSASSIRCATIVAIAALAGRADANPTLATSFQFLGPAPIAPATQEAVVSGAIQAVAVDPSDKNVVWIGSVNGGVWKTTDFHPNEPGHAPIWTALTDDQPSLSIAALSIDPTDTSGHTVVAALGDASSAASFHGPYVGVVRTTDDGAHWTSLGATDLSGQDLSGVTARGATIVVASASKTSGGVWRSTDTGHSFTRLSGTAPLPAGGATALVGDPAHPARMWVAVVGTGGGVFESDTTGASWTRVSPSALDTFASTARRIALDAQSYPHDVHEVYAALIDAKPPAGSTAPDIPAVFRLSQTGNGTTSADEMDASALPDFETFDQGKVAIAADPLHQEGFFIAGDEGLDYRCTRAIGGTTAATCTPISDKGPPATHTTSGTMPHPDARMLAFDTDTALLATDDGGIYVRSSPRKDSGDWTSKIGNLGINEAYWCAHDAHGGVTLCGSQDNGVSGQLHTGNLTWPALLSTDGGAVAVSDALFTCPWNHHRKCSSRYLSRHDLADFEHLDCDGTDVCNKDPGSTATMLALAGTTIACTNPSNPATCGDTGLTERTPLAADRFDAQRIAIAGAKLYESTDGGATVSVVAGYDGTPSPGIVMGGERNGHGNADVLLVATSQGLYARSAPGAVAATTWNVTTNGVPQWIAVDRGDWQSVWITTDQHTVWHGADVTGTHEKWTAVTGDLLPGGPSAQDLRAIVHVGGTYAYVAVGGDDGVYAARTSDLAHWYKLGGLPDVVIGTLSYSKGDDLLVIGTVGRSAWSIAHASTVFAPHIRQVHDPVDGPVHVNPGDPVETTPAQPAERRRRKPH